MSDLSAWRSMEDRRGHVEATRENSTRPGRAWATYNSTGVGYHIADGVITFGCNFLTMPIFTFGVVLDPAGIDLPADDPPRCTAGVYDWKRTGDGLYSGAFCWFVVDSYTAVVTTNLRMIFTLAFEGMASKDFISAHGFPVHSLDV